MKAAMNAAPAWWVVTDLDGTLLDHRYDWQPAEAAMRGLQDRGIPVIPCTSKTAEEVRRFRAEAGLHDPFIVENGGAVCGETEDGVPWELALGEPAEALRPVLRELERLVQEPLQAIDALTEEQAAALLGLTGEALQRAARRRWSLPFVPPSAAARLRLPLLAQNLGVSVVQGNRMGHLLGAQVSKGRALERLKTRMGGASVRVLALGDSPNDLPLLEAADVAVVVPGSDGPHPVFAEALASGRFQLASAPHAAGWAEAVQQVVMA
ncbi:glucosyl-3-phosphoglycerate phosphatase [Synechococcus sp. RS9909]|nr:glucosyl-3-phosphoglycerate phosphatase [Synechococcus sp. RS9909]